MPDRDHELDEHGYLRAAVEEWRAHGIYPPPLMGSASNPELVAKVREDRARWAAMSQPEQDHFVREAHKLADQIDWLFGIDSRPTEASRSL